MYTHTHIFCLIHAQRGILAPLIHTTPVKSLTDVCMTNYQTVQECDYNLLIAVNWQAE